MSLLIGTGYIIVCLVKCQVSSDKLPTERRRRLISPRWRLEVILFCLAARDGLVRRRCLGFSAAWRIRATRRSMASSERIHRRRFAAFRGMQGLPVTGQMNPPTRRALERQPSPHRR